MKLAFFHKETAFTSELLTGMTDKLAEHEVLSWEQGTPAPAPDLEGLVVMGAFTRQQMTDQPKLKFIQTASAGYETVDVGAADDLGIWVSFSPSGETGNAVSVAEFAVMLMIGASRQLLPALGSLGSGEPYASPATPALSGKTVCIVGLGGIGHLVAERLAPFDMRILAIEAHPEEVPDGVTIFPPHQLNTANAQSDYVVLCTRADKSNDSMIDAVALAAMKRGVILINIARGSLIDEAALMDAIQSGHVAAAGLDVLREEPAHPQNPLLGLPQVFITPHIAGMTDIMLSGTIEYVAKAIGQFAQGVKPRSLANAPQKPRLPLSDQQKG